MVDGGDISGVAWAAVVWLGFLAWWIWKWPDERDRLRHVGWFVMIGLVILPAVYYGAWWLTGSRPL